MRVEKRKPSRVSRTLKCLGQIRKEITNDEVA